MEGRYAFLNNTNNLYDGLIDAPNPIEHPHRRLDQLIIYICLDSIKCNIGRGAKIVHQVEPCTSWGKPV